MRKITIEVRYFYFQNEERDPGETYNFNESLIETLSDGKGVTFKFNQGTKIKKFSVPIPKSYVELQSLVAAKIGFNRLFICERENGRQIFPHDDQFEENETIVFREFQPFMLRTNLNQKRLPATWERDYYFPSVSTS